MRQNDGDDPIPEMSRRDTQVQYTQVKYFPTEGLEQQLMLHCSAISLSNQG